MMDEIDFDDLIDCIDDDPGYSFLFRLLFWWAV